jgi:ribokinase
MGNHIVVVGSLNMDLVVRTLRHPQIGETVIGHDFHTYPGGKGANQAVAAARLGSKVIMIGKVGNDQFGDALLQAVTTDGVNTQYISRDTEVPTGVAVITVDDLGKNTIVVASGANSHLSPNEIDVSRDAFRGASILLLQLECPLNAVERAIDIAKRSNMQIVLNPAPAQLLDASLLQRVDYLIPNQTELAQLSGQESIDAAIGVLQGMGVNKLVVTLGEEGSLIVDKGQRIQIPAFKVHAVDSTAAGDAFAGAFAMALGEGMTIQKAAVWGNAAGALAVTKAGAQPSLPWRDELDEFLIRHTTTL